MPSVAVALNQFEYELQITVVEEGAPSLNIVDCIGEKELRAAAPWGGRIPGVVRPLRRWQVEEEAR